MNRRAIKLTQLVLELIVHHALTSFHRHRLRFEQFDFVVLDYLELKVFK